MPDLTETPAGGESEKGTQGVAHPSHYTRRRAGLGYDARSERRALRGAARRRKARARMWLVGGPVVVVVALVVTLLVMFGGSDNKGHAGAVSSTVPAAVEKAALLVVQQDSGYPVTLLLQTRSSGGVVLGVSGITLVKAGDSFQPLSAVVAGGQKEALTGAFADAFGAQVNIVASVSWTALRAAMAGAGVQVLPASTLTSGETDAAQVAAAMLGLLRVQNGAGSAGGWESLTLAGDASQFRSAAERFASAAAAWVSAGVTGDVVDSGGSTYLNPDVEAVKAVLTSTESGAGTAVVVQNGSGALDVADKAVLQLQPLGYKVSAGGNSSDFPSVEQTRIEVAAGQTDAGQRVKAVLGVGTVTESETLQSGQVVVVLGKDYSPPVAGAGGTSPGGSAGQ